MLAVNETHRPSSFPGAKKKKKKKKLTHCDASAEGFHDNVACRVKHVGRLKPPLGYVLGLDFML